MSCFVYVIVIIVFKVDLDRIMKVYHIATQGASDGKGYIKSYKISTKDYPNSLWKPLTENDKPKVGNLGVSPRVKQCLLELTWKYSRNHIIFAIALYELKVTKKLSTFENKGICEILHVVNNRASVRLVNNRQFSSSLVPCFQNESPCKTFHI